MPTSRNPSDPGPDSPGRRPDPPGDPERPVPDTQPGRSPEPDPHPEPGRSPGPQADPKPERTTARAQVAALVGRMRAWPRPSRRQTATALAVVAACLLAAWTRCGVRGCPDVGVLAAYQHGGGPLLLDRGGMPLARVTPLARTTVPIGSLPAYLPEAFIAVEDKRFRDHGGVDWRRVPGALLANLRSREIAQGFSTITMQLARNVFPERLPASQRTFRRKALEIRVAGAIENRFTKDEILELYLNHTYFGGGAYGVEAASRYYFGKPAAKLTLAQAATLAAIPRGPSLYDPRRHPESARARRDLVLGLMERQGQVDAEAARSARDAELAVLAKPPRARDRDPLAPYFIEEIRKALEDRYGSDLYHGRMRIHTTLDRELQVALEEELERQVRAVERGAFGRFRHPDYEPGRTGAAQTLYLQSAGLVLDARTGDILALVGGRDHDQSTFDRAVLGRRQLGSAFKPFVYAAALAKGWTTIDQLDDEPLRLAMDGGRAYEPHNFDGSFSGPVSLREALVKSLNVPTVRLATQVGTGDIAALARAAGLHGEMAETPAMALGTVSASPLEVALAYTPFATLGTAVRRPRWVTMIEDEDGKELFAQDPDTEAALDPAVAYLVTDILSDVVDRGTGSGVRRADFRGVAAGKTGTTSNGRDVWFVGYTPELVGVVWMGLDRPATILAGAAGGQLVAPVWGRMMARVARTRAMPGPWEAPAGIVTRRADPNTGRVLSDGCWLQGGVEEVFLEGTAPPASCPEQPRRGFFDRTLGWLGGIFDR